MEELLIEEKAKRYDKAIKVAADIKAGIATYITDGTPVIDAIFPELKESEDEKIRKEIIKYVQYLDEYYGDSMPKFGKWLAWLEKQGEQKPIDPDTIIQQRVDALADIVAEQKPADTEKGAKGNDREILISEPPLTIKHAREVMGIKQDDAFGEEDVKMIGTLIAIFEVNYPDGFYKVNPIGTTNMQGIHSSEIIKWLKSLKERYTWKPSEEQLKSLQKAIDTGYFTSYPNSLETLYEQLKKLKGEQNYEN